MSSNNQLPPLNLPSLTNTPLINTPFEVSKQVVTIFDVSSFTPIQICKLLPHYLKRLDNNPTIEYPTNLLCCLTYASLFPEAYLEILNDLKRANRSNLTSWYSKDVEISELIDYPLDNLTLLNGNILDELDNSEIASYTNRVLYLSFLCSILVIKDKTFTNYKPYIHKRYQAALMQLNTYLDTTDIPYINLGLGYISAESGFNTFRRDSQISILFLFPLVLKYHTDTTLLGQIQRIFLEQILMLGKNARFTQMNLMITNFCNNETINKLKNNFPQITADIRKLIENVALHTNRLGSLFPYIRAFIDLTGGAFYARNYPHLTSLFVVCLNKNENKGDYVCTNRGGNLLNLNSVYERAYKQLTSTGTEGVNFIETLKRLFEEAQREL